jgi:hypothetical protein
MTLHQWQRKHKAEHYAAKRGDKILTLIPSGARRELGQLSDYKLTRTDNYKGNYIALLEKRNDSY